MGNRCSIQQGEENNCWLEQNSEKSTVSDCSVISGPPSICIALYCLQSDIETPDFFSAVIIIMDLLNALRGTMLKWPDTEKDGQTV